jgi:hypothetical protein
MTADPTAGSTADVTMDARSDAGSDALMAGRIVPIRIDVERGTMSPRRDR